MRLIFFSMFMSLTIFASFTIAFSQEITATKTPIESQAPIDNLEKSFLNLDLENAPTYIKSDLLTLKNKERVFQYSNNVEVKQADLTITAKNLQGGYDEANKIQWMEAKTNVMITKGQNIRARGETARFEQTTNTIVLTDNPELQQEGSVLTADAITIYLNEDRSVAEGAVRVKLIDKEKETADILAEQQEEALSEASK